MSVQIGAGESAERSCIPKPYPKPTLPDRPHAPTGNQSLDGLHKPFFGEVQGYSRSAFPVERGQRRPVPIPSIPQPYSGSHGQGKAQPPKQRSILFRKHGPGIKEHLVRFDTGDDGRIALAKPTHQRYRARPRQAPPPSWAGSRRAGCLRLSPTGWARFRRELPDRDTHFSARSLMDCSDAEIIRQMGISCSASRLR